MCLSALVLTAPIHCNAVSPDLMNTCVKDTVSQRHVVLEYGVPAHTHTHTHTHTHIRITLHCGVLLSSAQYSLSPFLEHDLVPPSAGLSRDQLLQVSDRVLLTDTHG